MDKKQFLEYLCSIGLGRRDTLTVPAPCPDYPFSKSIYVQKGSTFYTTQHRYTIEIPIPVAVQDNNPHEPQISLPAHQVTQSPAFWERLLTFLEDIARSNHVYHQRYGVTFFGGQGGWDYSKYRADKRDAMDISPLSAVTSVAMSNQVSKDPLNFATALNYIKDIMLSLENNPVREKRGFAITDKVEKAAHQRPEKKKENTVTIPAARQPDREQTSIPYDMASDTTVVRRDTIANIHPGPDPYLRSTFIVDGTEVNHYSMPGDTLSLSERITYQSGRVKLITIELLPATTVSIEGSSRIVSDAYKKWKKK